MNNIGQQLDTTSTINQLVKSVETLRSDLHQIHSRINLMERSLADVRNQQLRKKVKINIEISVLNFNSKSSMNKSKILELKYPKWWPFLDISPAWFVFVIIWPFVASRLVQAIQRKKWFWPVIIDDIPDHHKNKSCFDANKNMKSSIFLNS